MELYTPVLALMLIAAGFAVFSVIMSSLVGPRRYNRAKADSYECGIEPTPQALGGGRFPVKYYITAMLFIVFDIETVFMIPWGAIFFGDNGGAAAAGPGMGFLLVEMLAFIFILAVGFVYVWKRKALEWD